jgi:hypothetical protein
MLRVDRAEERRAGHRKDVLRTRALMPGPAIEVFAHKEFCAGRLTLDEARALFTADWRIEYRKRFGAC